MPAYDRYWRLGVGTMALIGVFATGLFVWYLVTGGSLEHLLGPGITYSNTCQVVWAVLLLCILVSHLAAARKRDQARHAALRGDLDAMPLSRIMPGDTATTTPELLTARGTVSADDEGLHFRGAYRRHPGAYRRHIARVPWDEARLLEVWLSDEGRQAARGFSLYGERTRIEWSLPRGRQARTQKQSDIEAALLATVHARTGLVPRTLSPTLRAPDTRPAERHGPNPFGTFLTIVVALLPFAVADAAIALPLTTEPALNAYVALSFVVLGLVVVVITVQALAELFRRPPLPEPGTILPPGVPPPDTSGTGIYALRWRNRARTRLGEAALGVLFAGNVVPLIGILVGAETSAAGDLSVILNFSVGGAALFGVLLLLDAAPSGRHTVTADAAGLTAGRQTLRWGDVEDVVAKASGRTVAEFKVVGDDGDVTIEWPAKAHATPRPGAQALSPSELAALVVARSGKALRVED